MVPARSPLSREAQLLLLTARDAPADGRASELLAAGIDWPTLVRLAQQERATAICWRWLQTAGDARPSGRVAAHWHKLAMVADFEARQLESLLYDTLDLLAERGIDTMLLKGAALACTVYPSFAERPMGDLDVLVPPDRAREAWSLLQTAGWRWPAAHWPRERYSAHQHLPPLVAAAGGAARLEIHAALLPEGHPFDWPVDDVWAAARPISVARANAVLVPRRLDQLLHVCLHFAWSHEMQWGCWRALRDVAALTARGLADDGAAGASDAWAPFVDAARRARAATCCYWMLRLARTFVGAAVPDAVLHALRPPRPEFILARLEAHFARHLFPTEDGCPSQALSNALWEAGIAPRWSGHGSARPWHVSQRWAGVVPPRAPISWRRVVNRAHHGAQAVAYLGRLIAMRPAARPSAPRQPRPAA